MSEPLRAAIDAAIERRPGGGFTLHCTDALLNGTLRPAVEALSPLVAMHRPEILVTCGTAGLLLAAGLHAIHKIPACLVRKEPRAGRMVEGAPPKGRAVFVDDVLHTGSTLDHVRMHLPPACQVVAAVVLVDYEVALLGSLRIRSLYRLAQFGLGVP
jgi:orotate phosphoribosyltransferase